MSLFLKITASSDQNRGSISVCCFGWKPLVFSLSGGECARKGEWEEGRELFFIFFNPPPLLKRGREKSRIREQLETFQSCLQTFVPTKPLNPEKSLFCQLNDSMHCFVWNLVIWFKTGGHSYLGFTVYHSQQCALMTGSKLIPFVWEGSPPA